MSFDALADFASTEFEFEGRRRQVFRKGEGPAVIVMTEIPGITPQVARFARRVVDLGCTVVMPQLFGNPGQAISPAYIATSFVRTCVSKEFACFAKGSSAPVTTWLRALAREMHKECGGPGVGAIGMCLTGGFALALTLEDSVIAPVLAQPSLPLGITAEHRADLGISATELRVVKDRVEAGLCFVGLRFSEDALSPKARFEKLQRELGDGFIGVEIDSSSGNAYGHSSRAHSPLTTDLVDEPGTPTHDALTVVLDHFRTRLLPV